MNVHLARMFYEDSQQAALLAMQKTMTPKLPCEKLGVEMGKFQLGPYLEEMKVEIENSYPIDILAMIVDRKATAKASMSSSSANIELGSPTLEPTMRPAYLPSSKTEVGSSALAK